MRSKFTLALGLCLLFAACSTRDFLTRGLAGAEIANSDAFKAPQQFFLRTGLVSNMDYTRPEYLVLQRRGWITGVTTPCTAEVSPPPCWDVALTPIGVETFRDLIAHEGTPHQYFSISTAKRQLIAVTGIAKSGNSADVDFTWKWTPMNEVGAALAQTGVQFKSSVAFRHYDDGWRVIEGSAAKTNQGLDDALKDAQAAQ
jgi:hypothetical protein